MIVSTAGALDTEECDLGELALQAARAGRAAIARVLAEDELRIDTKSGAHDFVTSADRASEAAIIDVIRNARPADTILAEETGVHVGSSATRWLVDPLDGTANFVKGRKDYGTSVGVTTAGKFVAGALIRHSDGRWIAAGAKGVTAGWAADAGESAPGATVRRTSLREARQPVHLGTAVAPAQAMVAIGMPYPIAQRQQALEVVRDLVPSVNAVRILGSAACDFLGLATGECDAYVAFNLAEWDTAGGQAITLAAGGAVRHLTHSTGMPVLIAGTASLVEQLEAVVRSSRNS